MPKYIGCGQSVFAKPEFRCLSQKPAISEKRRRFDSRSCARIAFSKRYKLNRASDAKFWFFRKIPRHHWPIVCRKIRDPRRILPLETRYMRIALVVSVGHFGSRRWLHEAVFLARPPSFITPPTFYPRLNWPSKSRALGNPRRAGTCFSAAKALYAPR